MLTIRQAQFDLLGRLPRAQFEADLERHLRVHFSHECARGDVRGFVRLGIDRAAAHGFATQRNIALYLNLMAMLGAEFDEDPQLPWVLSALDDISISSSTLRIDKFYDLAVEFLEATGGEDNRHLLRALLRIRKRDFDVLSGVPEDAMAPALAALLKEIYPERAAYATEPALRKLAQLAATTARRRGASTGRAAGIHTVHMFMLGSGYERDPLYPWIREILDGSDADPMDARFDRVREATLDYMESILRD